MSLFSNGTIKNLLGSEVASKSMRGALGLVKEGAVYGMNNQFSHVLPYMKQGGHGMWGAAKHYFSAADKVGKPDRWKSIAARGAVGLAGVDVSSRLLGGGGAYKDRYGRTNVAGLPFI